MEDTNSGAATRLPVELFPCIIQHLSDAGLVRVALTCSALSILALNQLYGRVEFSRDTPLVVVNDFLTGLLYSEFNPRRIRYLALDWMPPPMTFVMSHVTDEQAKDVAARLAALLPSMTNLRSLSLPSHFRSSVNRVLKRCDYLPLRELHIFSIVGLDPQLIANCTSLEKLTLYGDAGVEDVQSADPSTPTFQNLRWLCVGSTEALHRLISVARMPALQTLAIKPTTISNDRILLFYSLARDRRLRMLRSIQLLERALLAYPNPSTLQPLPHITHVAASCWHVGVPGIRRDRIAGREAATALAVLFPSMSTLHIRCSAIHASHSHPSPIVAFHAFETTMLELLPSSLRRFVYLTDAAFERGAPGAPFLRAPLSEEDME